jgi:hypothetical protein
MAALGRTSPGNAITRSRPRLQLGFGPRDGAREEEGSGQLGWAQRRKEGEGKKERRKTKMPLNLKLKFEFKRKTIKISIQRA